MLLSRQEAHMRNTMKICLVGLLWLVVAAVFPNRAEAWENTNLTPADGPSVFVDKELNTLSLWDGQTIRRWTCTWGQVQGDKQVRNDRKTPEGVYFVTGRRTGLNFEEYGGIAYPLDYPNPVDRLRGKTGSGIWVHSKGRAIRPNETRGCVAVDLGHLAQLGPYLQKGTPVVIGQRVEANFDAASIDRVRTKTAAQLVLEGRPTTPEQVQVLEGPGYWVAWSGRTGAESLRLYWESGPDGTPRLVGRAQF